jgi:hypothetical protein
MQTVMNDLADDNKNMTKYAKDGTATIHLDKLKYDIQEYEDEFRRNHPGTFIPGASGPAPARPPPFVPGSAYATPSAPPMPVGCHWVLVRCYPPPASSSRWSCQAP